MLLSGQPILGEDGFERSYPVFNMTASPCPLDTIRSSTVVLFVHRVHRRYREQEKQAAGG